MANKGLYLRRLMFSMASLADLGNAVTSSKDVAERMKAALYVVTGMFSVPAAALFVYDAQRKSLELFAHKGHKDKVKKELTLSVPANDIKAFRINEPHTVSELAGSVFFQRNAAAFRKLQAKIFIPLFVRDQFVGTLALGRKLGRAEYRQSDKDILRVVAHQMAITLHNAGLFLEISKKAAENRRLYESMRRIYHDTIQAFSAAIDAKDEYTKDHSYRVACYAVAVAKELGWKKKDVEGIYVAGLLHDIGKIIIDSQLIQKGEKLTATEISQIKKHPQVSYDILSKINFPWKNIEHFVRRHHERLDGKGYPDALVSADLTEGEKILALVDAFDAMTTDRPYRNKLSLDDAFREVINCSGTQFDQGITNTFFAIIRKELNGQVKKPQILPHLQYLDMERFKTMAADPDTPFSSPLAAVPAGSVPRHVSSCTR